ncbi:unnamed protein product [Caenorhabditis bovis]|uniref:Uncharacterized protein n=1 Tax=Caenorhabditis bovis TaxID=2654633 RepID=A0A8S1E3G7_9PELO|nr:unnamed protein product [Caenorhabditis bovis]
MDQASTSVPGNEELLELVEKQDDVVAILQIQLETCMEEMKKLAERCRELELKEKNNGQIEEEKLKELNDNIEKLKFENERLRDENRITRTEDSNVLKMASFVELQLKCKELEYEVEREKLATKSLNFQLELEKSVNSQIRTELESLQNQIATKEEHINVKTEMLEKEMNNWKMKYEELSAKTKAEIAELKEQVSLCESREKLVEQHIKKAYDESLALKREKSTAHARIETLVEENASLRAKILRFPKCADSVQSENEIKDLKCLLNDQSHLIAALREETKLLAKKLENDTRENKSIIKGLKRENKQLEERLQNLLNV